MKRCADLSCGAGGARICRAQQIKPGDSIKFGPRERPIPVLEGEPYIYEHVHPISTYSCHRGQWHVPADYLFHTQHVCVAIHRNGVLRSDIEITRSGEVIYQGSVFRRLQSELEAVPA